MDGQGRFVIPGLWDMHAHMEMTGESSLQLYVANGDVFFAIADEARRQKLPVAGHVPLKVTIQEGVDAGMVSIEHLSEDGTRLESVLRRIAVSSRCLPAVF